MTYFEPIPLGKPVVPQPPRPPSMPAGGGRIPAAPRGFTGARWARARALAEWHETWDQIRRGKRVLQPAARYRVPLPALAVPIAALGMVIYQQNVLAKEYGEMLAYLRPDARWPKTSGTLTCSTPPANYVESPWCQTNPVWAGCTDRKVILKTNYNGQLRYTAGRAFVVRHWIRSIDATYNYAYPRDVHQYHVIGTAPNPIMGQTGPVLPAAPAPRYDAPRIPWRYVRGAIKLRDQLAPREDLQPSRESPPWKNPRPPAPPSSVGVGVDAGGNLIKWVMPPHRHAPPPKGVKERKSKLGPTWGALAGVIGEKHARMAKGGIDAVTETLDFIEALYYALPAHYRVRDATPQEMVYAIYNGYEALDIGQALTNLGINELNDRAIGKLSQARNSALSKAGFIRRFMEFYGPAI